MTCEQYQQQISALLDGELASSFSASLFAHMAGCDACRTFVSELTTLNRRLSAELQSDTPGASPEPVRARAPEPWMSRLWQHRITMRLSLVAAIVLLAAGGVFWILTTRAAQTQPQRVYVSTLPVVEVVATQ